MDKRFSLFCFDDHEQRIGTRMSGGRGKKARGAHRKGGGQRKAGAKAGNAATQRAVQRAVAANNKRWEFNLIKTGNNSVQYNSNNAVRTRGVHAAAPGNLPVLASAASGEVAVTNALSRTRDQIVEHDEVIGVVSGNTGFEASAFDINPGLSSIFPWLSVLASLFERYQFDDLVLYFKPIGSGFATNNQVGKVILCADYDSTESTPGNYRQAETMDPHSDGMPFQTIELHLDPRRLNKEPKFTRVGPPPPGTDVKMYDAGNVYFCVQGTANSADIGELRVRYRLRLMNPRLPSIASQVSPNNTTVAAHSAVNTSLTNSTWSTVDIATVVANGVGATMAATQVTLQQGNYLVSMMVRFSDVGGSGSFSATQAAILLDAEPDGGDIDKTAFDQEVAVTFINHTMVVERYITVSNAGAVVRPRVFGTFTGVKVASAAIIIRLC